MHPLVVVLLLLRDVRIGTRPFSTCRLFLALSAGPAATLLPKIMAAGQDELGKTLPRDYLTARPFGL
jgi:hypothetical protein